MNTLKPHEKIATLLQEFYSRQGSGLRRLGDSNVYMIDLPPAPPPQKKPDKKNECTELTVAQKAAAIERRVITDRDRARMREFGYKI